MKELNAKNYSSLTKNKIKFKKTVVLSPHKWLAKDLIKGKPITWRSNDALIFKGNKYDVVICLPGASMAMITLEEIIACGVKEVIFIGTGAGLMNQPSGSILKNPKIISVLNPFTEQEDLNWSKIKKEKIEIVDMEAAYLKILAKKRKIKLTIYLIVADHVSRKSWQPLKMDTKYKLNYAKNIKELKEKIIGVK